MAEERTHVELQRSVDLPRALGPMARAERERRAQRLLLLTVRMLFIVMLLTVSLLPFVGTITEQQSDISFGDYVGQFIATLALGVIVVVIDVATPNKRLATVFGIYLGIVAGLVGALAIGALIDLVAESWELTREPTGRAYIGLVKLAIGITLCYLATSIVLTTKDDIRLAIPYVEFSKQVRGVQPLLIDTSILIDGRVDALGRGGFFDAPLVIPRFVIDELQTLADSADKLKRAKGRRGLGMVTSLQDNALADTSLDATDVEGHSVDHKLLTLAHLHGMRILTTDHNLQKVAEIRGVHVLNLNDAAAALKAHAVPGDHLQVEIVKRGESAGQGVGYLPDGTMVVVEDSARDIGHTLPVIVTNSLQTSAGKMIFARPDGAPLQDVVADTETVAETDAPESANADAGAESGDQPSRIAKAATAQPRRTGPPPQRGRVNRERNPRR